ncbi:MAG: SLAP domain-containing protein [Schleiferilactobacillus harbinensis]
MKKSRIKYVGLVAAALLAAAPIAASVVTTIAAPVYAAEETPTAADVDQIRVGLETTIEQGKAQIQEYDQKLADVEAAKDIDQQTIEDSKAQAAQILEDMQDAYNQMSAEEKAKNNDLAKSIQQGQAQIEEYNQKLDQIAAAKDINVSDITSSKAQAQAYIDETQAKLDGFNAAGIDASTGVPEKTDAELADKTQGYRDVYHEAYQLATKLIEINGAEAGTAAGTQDAQDGKVMADLTSNGPDYQAAYKQAYYAYQKTNGTYEQGYAAGQADAAKDGQELKGDAFGSKSNAYRVGYHAGFADTRGHILDIHDARIALQTAIRNGQALINTHGGDYTSASINFFQQALDAATGLLNSDKATIEQLAQAVTDLGKAAGTLAKPTTPTRPITPTYPGTTLTPTVDPLTESPASGIAYVTAQAGIPLYSDKETTNQIGRTLAANSSWKIFGKVTNSAGTIVAYNLGGKQYVKASDITLTNPVTKGTFTVRYSEHPTWGIAVYNGALKVQKIIPAGSRWATYGKKTINGQEYYSLGGDQYARADYGSWIAD